MKIHHIRNATMIIEAGDKVILIDPMIGPRGTMPPFAFIKSKARRNPTVAMPKGKSDLLERVTHCLITHQHPDHLDAEGIRFLRKKQIPVICSSLDEGAFKKRGFNITQTVDYWKRSDFLGGKIEGIPARHGYGFVAKPAGNVMGFYIELPGERSVYLSSDTIYTRDVEKVLLEYKPDVSVVAAGSARFDLFKPLLMTVEDIVRFIEDAPGRVIANHLESVNHCPTTREQLKTILTAKGLSEKTFIPEDGESIEV
ncbi:MAG: MBL fold metallo-hydrolase [Bacteroidota bacterium]